MTLERINILEREGFVWAKRKGQPIWVSPQKFADEFTIICFSFNIP